MNINSNIFEDISREVFIHFGKGLILKGILKPQTLNNDCYLTSVGTPDYCFVDIS